ncbi:RNA splicing protein mrs2, mitochondrial, putative [Ricinus communis]|uniref:Magnesium transporter n=1 Tax=Ricinus communis TaxID=3988 RepID=B9S826_RICCO|nr:RNA splicing protein mrs2, mitochondrial, putative [Ricinus communis]
MSCHPPPLTPKPDEDADPLIRPTQTTTTTILHTTRKKGIGVRAWLLLDSTGQTQIVEAGKHAIMRRTGLPARDLRILDPQLSYPSTVLGRERAIVINLEHIKAIITSQEVLLLNSKDPSVIPFVDELQRRLLCHYNATKAQEGNGNDANWTTLNNPEEPQSKARNKNFPGGFRCDQDGNEAGKVDGRPSLENRDRSNVLPFEFVALEACLEAACGCLENEAKTLEQEAHPALDKLTSKISTLNLERVRQIKSRLVAITGRVQKVRDELEHLLDDDEDMAEMYLTEKSTQHLENSCTSSLNERDDMDDEYVQDDFDERDSHGTRSSTTQSAISKHLDVEELEMLLEAYFVQIDGTLNKLSTLREYVDDTEDYINIMLDDKQNHLLQMGVMLTTATLIISFGIVVAGIFGMNIKIELFKEAVETGMPKFLWTVGGSCAGSLFLYVVAIAWCKHKRLLE